MKSNPRGSLTSKSGIAGADIDDLHHQPYGNTKQAKMRKETKIEEGFPFVPFDVVL
jgi:hypothetical protein